MSTGRVEHQRSITTERVLAQSWVDGEMLARWLRLYGYIGWRSWFRRRHRTRMEVAIKDGRLVMRRIEWSDSADSESAPTAPTEPGGTDV